MTEAGRHHSPEPDPVLDPDAVPERLGTGMTWTEGPVWLPDREAVIFSDIPVDRIMRWDATNGLTVHRTDVEFSNGRTLDRDGTIIACSHGRRAVEREHPDGTTEIVVDRFGAHRLNSPNDIVVSRDGSIWFTDPPYGITQPQEGHPGRREYSDNFVFASTRPPATSAPWSPTSRNPTASPSPPTSGCSTWPIPRATGRSASTT